MPINLAKLSEPSSGVEVVRKQWAAWSRGSSTTSRCDRKGI